ncbi:hypothetical protein BS78_08G158300 [Paspalum vaginatum]|nr:hypothetical protein BS78_08G158300 [Paspalum vaginatum]
MSLALARVILLVLIVIGGGGGIVVPAAASLGHSGSSGHNRPPGSGAPTPHSSYIAYSGALSRDRAVCSPTCPSRGQAYSSPGHVYTPRPSYTPN